MTDNPYKSRWTEALGQNNFHAVKKERCTPPRFHVGSRVIINDLISNAHVGELGRVICLKPSRHSVTLDAYLVRLDSGIEREFWDVQLKRPFDVVGSSPPKKQPEISN